MTPKNIILKCWKMEPRNMLVFDPFVNAVRVTKIGWLFAVKPGKLHCFAAQVTTNICLARIYLL
jgi:hypothetical protein